MKKLLIVLSLFAYYNSSFAKSDMTEECKAISGLNGKIMEKRQEGASMSDIMDRMMSVDNNPESKKLLKRFIIAAYEQPRYSTAQMKQKSITDFENETYLQCIKKYGM